MRLEITSAAKQDLKSIARHTQQRWGLEQRNAYLREIDLVLRGLADNPMLGRGCEDILPGYRKLPHRRHVIYYTSTPTLVRIIRVLHARMDVHAQTGV